MVIVNETAKAIYEMRCEHIRIVNPNELTLLETAILRSGLTPQQFYFETHRQWGYPFIVEAFNSAMQKVVKNV